METGIQSSFIPKEAGSVFVSKAPDYNSAGLSELLVLISVILLIASSALAGGVFLYQQFLQRQITSKVAELKRAEASFEPSLIQQLTRLDERMHVSSTLLSAHMAPSVFFSSLDQATLTNISFGGLSIDAVNPKQIKIKMTGIAKSVNSIALQSNLFGKNSVISDPIFSSISHNQYGVNFSLVALINPYALNYTQMINNGQQASIPVLPEPIKETSPFTSPKK